MRAPRVAGADSSGTPLLPRMPPWAAAVIAALIAAPLAWWMLVIGMPAWSAWAAVAVYALVAACAQEGPQRLLGGGRLDNRPVLRTALALLLFGTFLNLAQAGFLLPVSGVLVAAIHVHWAGSAAWRRISRTTVAMSVLGQVLLGLHLVDCIVPPLTSYGLTTLALWTAVLAIANIGVTAARREEVSQALADAEARFRAVVQNSSDVAAVVDDTGTFTYISPAAETAFGVRPGDLLGRDVGSLVDPRDRTAALRHVRDLAAASAQASDRWEARLRNGAEPTRWLEFSARNLRADDVLSGVVLHLRDVTERRDFHQRLAYAASHDTLTGLHRRAEFLSRTARLLTRARPGCAVALLYCDLDRFKQINDTHGHLAGDEVLAISAERLMSALRPGDLIGRMGGDEFTAALPEIADLGVVAEVAKRMKASMAPNIHLSSGHVVSLGVSVGAAWTNDPKTLPDDLLHRADVAMYQDKREGARFGVPLSPVERIDPA